MKLPTFDQQIAAGAYKGWDPTAARADFNKTGGQDTGSAPTTSSSGGGNNGFDANAFFSNLQAKQDALTKQQAVDTQNRFNTNANDINSFNTTFQNAVQGVNGGPSLGDTINARYGVPQATKYASALGQQINNLSTNADNSGAGGYAGMNQVQGALGQLNNREAIAGTYAQGQENLASQEYTRELAPYQTQAQMLTDRLARESTAYTTQQQQQLDALIAQMNQGVSLTATQLNTANQLAIAEQGYQNELAKIKASQAAIPVAPGASVYNAGTNSFSKATVNPFSPTPTTPSTQPTVVPGITPGFQLSTSSNVGIGAV